MGGAPKPFAKGKYIATSRIHWFRGITSHHGDWRTTTWGKKTTRGGERTHKGEREVEGEQRLSGAWRIMRLSKVEATLVPRVALTLVNLLQKNQVYI